MGKAKRFNSYDNDVEQQRKLVKSYGLARQSNSVSAFRSMPQSAPTATNTDNEAVVATVGTGAITATQLASNAVTTVKILDSNVTFDKIQDISTMKVIGRTSAGSGVSSEISILDSDTMSGASATTLATSESIKAYVDASASSGSTSFVGFTADDDLSMGTYNIDGVDQLIFSSATSSDSPPTFSATDYGFEIEGGTTPTALDIRVPTGKFVNVKVAGTTEFTFKGNELDCIDNDICNVGTVFTDYIATSSGNANIRVYGHLDPISDDDYNLGIGSLRWKDLYLSDDIFMGGLLSIESNYTNNQAPTNATNEARIFVRKQTDGTQQLRVIFESGVSILLAEEA